MFVLTFLQIMLYYFIGGYTFLFPVKNYDGNLNRCVVGTRLKV